MIILRKNILLYFLLILGVLLVPVSSNYAYSQMKIETHEECSKKEKSEHSKESQHNACILHCMTNYTYVILFQPQIEKEQPKQIHIKKQAWFYKNVVGQSVFISSWVPPKIA